MKVFIILFSIFIIVHGSSDKKDKKKECDGVHIHGKYHKKEIISNGVNRPYQLSYHNKSVIFSQNVGDDKEDTFEFAYVRHGEITPILLNKTKNGFATTVDRKDNEVYLGGSDGVYAHNFSEPGKTKHIVKDHNIWDMFFHKHLYFIAYPSLRLYKRIDDKEEIVDHVPEKIFQFVVDGDEDIFITTRDGVYEIKNSTKERIFYEGPKVFRAIEVDHKGKAYFCGQNGIYVANKEKRKLEEIADIEHIFGITFDDDNNIIYSNSHEIIRLLPDKCKET